jgi:hypothetical protein
MRSVSVVPPCYYAHLAAFRGRILVTESLSDTESSVSGGTAGPTNVRVPLLYCCIVEVYVSTLWSVGDRLSLAVCMASLHASPPSV